MVPSELVTVLIVFVLILTHGKGNETDIARVYKIDVYLHEKQGRKYILVYTRTVCK